MEGNPELVSALLTNLDGATLAAALAQAGDELKNSHVICH